MVTAYTLSWNTFYRIVGNVTLSVELSDDRIGRQLDIAMWSFEIQVAKGPVRQQN